MTIGGALCELNYLLKADDIPSYYKPSIKAVMDTIELSRLENSNKWIPVSERLPEESGEYLIAIKDRGYAEISWFYPHNKKWSYRNADIVAWAYIPKPYKAESEDKE